MNTRNKGALAEYRFISTAISLDLRVIVPAVEGYPYDCVIDNGNRFYRIQVKYASYLNQCRLVGSRGMFRSCLVTR